MKVRAKFKVSRIENWSAENVSGTVQGVVLYAVTSGSDENKEFWAATPTGEIKLGCVNQSAADQFVPGQEVYVEFTSAIDNGDG